MKVICIDNSKLPPNENLKKFVIYEAEEHPKINDHYLVAIKDRKFSYFKRRFTVIEEND